MERVVTLGIEEAVEAIKGAERILLRHGVWNNYHEAELDQAIFDIRHSGYGADIFKGEGGIYYVSIPNHSDMW